MSGYHRSSPSLTGGFSCLPPQRPDGELTRVFTPQGREDHKPQPWRAGQDLSHVFLPFISGQSEAWQGAGMCLRPQSKELQCHKSKISLVVTDTIILSTSEKEEKKRMLPIRLGHITDFQDIKTGK